MFYHTFNTQTFGFEVGLATSEKGRKWEKQGPVRGLTRGERGSYRYVLMYIRRDGCIDTCNYLSIYLFTDMYLCTFFFFVFFYLYIHGLSEPFRHLHQFLFGVYMSIF